MAGAETTGVAADGTFVIDHGTYEEWTKDFLYHPKNSLAMNVCTRIDPFEVAQSRTALQSLNHVFEFKVENEGKPTTDQKNSGRCWIFAALNCIRIPFMKKYNLDDFEFSQTHLFYYDKIERCNFFLQSVADMILQRKEKDDGRLMAFKLNDPINDGGQWTMFVSLVEKYGLMPKKCFPESFCSGKTIRLNAILKSKLREYAAAIRIASEQESAPVVIQQKIEKFMGEIHKIVSICLGIPPTTFTWEYQDKAKKFGRVEEITPQDFFRKHVQDVFDFDAKVCFVSDPRNDYMTNYNIDLLGNVAGRGWVRYNNQPIDLLSEVTVASLKAGQPVWFGCDVSKRYAMKPGIEDLTLHDFELVFDTEVQLGLDRTQRLIYGESAMTHAMLFTGVSTDAEGKPTKFRVENSWGEDSGEKGYIVMTADWFRQFVYEVVVDRQFVSQQVQEVDSQTPRSLPAWDPMGTLAQ